MTPARSVARRLARKVAVVVNKSNEIQYDKPRIAIKEAKGPFLHFSIA